MRPFFLLLFLISFSHFIHAQDTIVKRNGETIIVKITEVNPDNIKYKQLNYLDGPTFFMYKQEINYIIYKNGFKDSFADYVPPSSPKSIVVPQDMSIQPSGWHYYYKDRNIREQDMFAVAHKQNDKRIDAAINQTENIHLAQNITLIGGAGLFVSGAYLYVKNQPRRRGRRGSSPTSTASTTQKRQTGSYLMLAGLTSEAVSIGLRFDRKAHAHIVMDLYNKTLIH